MSGTTRTGDLRYRPFGVTRFASGTTPTSYRFTGQREEAALGLYYYNARWYDPALGHFLSPDAIVPEAGNALDYHRYAYVRFNPLKYTDPTGRYSDQALMTHFGCETWACVEAHFQEGGSHAGLWGWLNVLLMAEDGDFVETFVVYNNQTAWVSGRFATQEGKIVVEQPQIRFGANAPHTSTAPWWDERTFAHMAQMGSWEGYHHAQYFSDRSLTSIYNQRYTDCRHQDCVAQTIDTIGVAGAGLIVASPACGSAVGICFGVGRGASTLATGAGVFWAGIQAFNGNLSREDMYMTSLTTAVQVSTKNPWLNLAASLAQLLWDSRKVTP
ncbi:RHS repeat-associated core domain-containing protein [Caldilinea sp.]|uniref:RHS repeat-associated core domain-containing protein n=1 Tax=Caldilinea sp. TaxID=2293560 RepID=UPI00261FC1B9|nr:RHS repeat-associated core domain-containing protein [uncultured Caldilinea sp.]